MRYFLLIFAVCVAVAAGIAGQRGSLSRKPPLYVFPDMRRQLKLRPQQPNEFFANGVSSQLPVPGTLPRGQPIQTRDGLVYPYEDSPVYSGRATGTTNFIETNPLPVTAQLLQRGRERYTIHCAPCHGQGADGNGITKKLGVMLTVANLHDKRIVQLPDGEIFHVITEGRNTMGAYGPNLPVTDRWAIIAYLRALQRARLGTLEEVPADRRSTLAK
jgi:mono/diheme cytochrome c family protein